MRGHRIVMVAVAVLLIAVPLTAQGSGRIEGTVTSTDSKGVGGVSVVVSELGLVQISRDNGSFEFENVPPGTYTLSFSLGDNQASESGVEVTSGGTTTIDEAVDWDFSFAETITVFSASRRRERITEAPAAVTTISEEEIDRESAHGQLPKLLEFTPGVETTQSGVFDYNLNTRGFNSSLNRRLVVLVDGRDPAVPFLASQEWAVISQYMNDLASAELVRGPSSALYGANAFNGVLNLVTRAPRYSQGGEFRVTGGELSTKKAEGRWATGLGGDWYLKLNGSYLESDDFSEDRNTSVEYSRFCTAAGQTECLAPEAVPRVVDENEATFGNLRLDKHFSNGDFFTIEGGAAEIQGPALQTGIGRFSLPKIERVWGRGNYTSEHFNILGYYNDRTGDEQTALQSGGITYLASESYQIEFQTNWDFVDGKVRLVAGGSYGEEEIDTANPQGRQTLVFSKVDSDAQAVYAQVDFDLGDKVKLVLAGRYDESSLHDSQFSPKGSLVFSFTPDHSLRLSYNEAFQLANYSELFLFTTVGVVPGAFVDGLVCGSFGLSCGLNPSIPVIASGNESLELEEVEAWEIGYTGILGKKAFLTVDYYNSTLTNFITDLLPQTGTALGQINPNYGPFTAAGIPQPILDALIQTIAGLTNGGQLTTAPDGSQIITAVSYTNFGEVETQGIDLGLNVYFTPRWRFDTSYSWFDFDIKDEIAGDPLVPNAPENKASVGLSYLAPTFDVGISARWVDDFFWSVGTLFRGTVDSYETVDLTANYRFSERWEFGLNVTNLFDDEHFESFGGDLIGRRALAHVAFRW